MCNKLPESPENAFAITPNDSTDLTIPTTWLYIGSAGTVKVDMLGNGTVTYTALVVGEIHKIRAKRVYSTGTSASSILGLY